MPRPRFSTWIIGLNLTVPAGGTLSVPIDLLDTFYPQIMVMATYAKTGTSAGLTCVIYPGFAIDAAQDVTYATNGQTITEFASVTVATGQNTPQTFNVAFAVNPEAYPRYLNMVLTNADSSNAVSVSVIGDR